MNRTGQPGCSSDNSATQSDPTLSIGKPMSKQKKQRRRLNGGVSKLVRRRYTEVGTPDNRIIVVSNQVLMPRTKTSKPVLDP
jgi:hypothetical protein